MNEFAFSPLFWLLAAAAAAAALFYFRGSRRNRLLAKSVSAALESAFAPREKEYEQIGGLIGFHARYVCPGPFPSVKITFTMKPRHSLLFLPVSALLGGADRLYLTIESKEPVIGECHLIERSYYRGRCPEIAEEGSMEKDEVDWEGRPFVRLSAGIETKEALGRIRQALRPASTVRHFCSYPGLPAHIYLYLHPGAGREEELGTLLESLRGELSGFLKKR